MKMSELAQRILGRLRLFLFRFSPKQLGRASRTFDSGPRPTETLIETFEGSTPFGRDRKICLFAGYDPAGRIDPWVLRHLRAIRAAGFDIVFVTTGPEFQKADLEAALTVCALVVRRKNAGLDFGSWALGFQLVQKRVPQIQRLLLVNDSIYGPFRPINEIISEFERVQNEVCGLNDSFERTYHLQSFFLYFKAEVVRSNVFKNFWSTVRCDPDKDKLIDLCEIGLSQRLLKSGYPPFAMYPCQKVWEAAWRLGSKFQYASRLHKEPLNTTLFCWDILFKDFGYPYLKTELLRTNRFDSIGIKDWHKLAPQADPVLIAEIEAHAQRMRNELPTAQGMLQEK